MQHLSTWLATCSIRKHRPLRPLRPQPLSLESERKGKQQIHSIKIHPNRNENELDFCIQYIDTIKTLLTRSKNVVQTAVQICTLDHKNCTRINILHMRTNSAPRIKSAPQIMISAPVEAACNTCQRGWLLVQFAKHMSLWPQPRIRTERETMEPQ